MKRTSPSCRPKSALRRTTLRRSRPAWWVAWSWRVACPAASATSARHSPPHPSVRLTAGWTGRPLPRNRGAEGRKEDQRPQNNIPPSQTNSIFQLLFYFFHVLCFGFLCSSWPSFPSQNLSTLVISFCPWAIDEGDEALDTRQVAPPNLSSLNFCYCTWKWS